MKLLTPCALLNPDEWNNFEGGSWKTTSSQTCKQH